MAITNTTQIASLLRPGLAAVTGAYKMYPSQWSDIYDVYTSDKAFETEVEMKMLGLAQIRPEGMPTAVDSMAQRVVTQYVHKYVGLSMIITRQAVKDNLYKTKFPLMVKALMQSMAQTKDVLGASVLNNGFNPNYPIGDGQALFSTSHPIDGGTVANTPQVASDLTEGSLEQAIIAVQQFRNQAGLIIKTQPQKLIVPTTGQFVANRLLYSEFRVQTANNDISAINNMGMIPKGVKTNQYLSTPNMWILLTDAPDGFKHYVREELETDVYTDFSTDNLMTKALERYSFGVTNFRAAYASAGI